MTCFACTNEAAQQCRHCGKLYCEDHGDNLCVECLDPASAVPSAALFRGSLLALIVGTAVIIWLALAPPALPGDAVEIEGSSVSAEPPAAETELTPEPTEPAATPASQQTPPPPTGPATTATPGGATCPPETEVTADGCVYVVQEGDTVGTIAEQFGVPEQQIVDANALADLVIQIGQGLIVVPAQ
ncbi:MAG: LysM peptidoglycan-binding domain-containing protein [Dehalococcoidia bacterium]|nr:LysM peptidoglycan-binding domain-containing protein [Dehalococcoidia bacterium]